MDGARPVTLLAGVLLGLTFGVLLGAYITGLGLKHHTCADGTCRVDFQEP